MTFRTTLHRVRPDGTETAVTVTVAYAYDPAGGDGRTEPRYGASVEVESVTGADGEPVETTEAEDVELAAEAMEDAGECQRARACAEY